MDVVDYTQKEARLERGVSRLTEESLNSPLGVAFVMFESINSSKAAYDDLRTSYLSFTSSDKYIPDVLKGMEGKTMGQTKDDSAVLLKAMGLLYIILLKLTKRFNFLL